MKNPLDNVQRITLRFIITACILYAAVLISALAIFFLAEQSVSTLIGEDLELQAIEKAEEFKLLREIHLTELRYLATDPRLLAQLNSSENLSAKALEQQLRTREKQYITLTDIEGKVIIGRGRSEKESAWFTSTKEQGRFEALPVWEGDTAFYLLAIRIEHQNKHLGVLTKKIPLSALKAELLNKQNSKHKISMIHGDEVYSFTEEEQFIPPLEGERGFLVAEQRAYGYAHLAAGKGIFFLVEGEKIRESEIMQRLKQSLMALLITMFLGMIIAMILFYNAFTKPIGQLCTLAKKLSEGEEIPSITGHRKDEMKQLEEQIRWMATVFKNAEENLQRVEDEQHTLLSKEIDKKTKELEAMVNNLKKSRLATFNIMEDLQEANKDLEEKDQVKTDFLNMISHELKTPLTPIKANLDMLMDQDFGDINEMQMKALTTLMRNVIRLEGIIKNLLEISRIEAGKIVLDKEKTNLNAFIKEILEEFLVPCKEKGLRLEFKKGKLPKIECDQERVKECLLNYLNNALKFTEKGSISVKTCLLKENGRSFAEISVSDTGKGIEEKNLKFLFQKFYQEGKIEVGKAKGVGLGLYSVRKIIEVHGGSVGVERLEPGSRFWFRLPKESENGKNTPHRR
jgi:signal transduction histidine kinase